MRAAVASRTGAGPDGSVDQPPPPEVTDDVPKSASFGPGQRALSARPHFPVPSHQERPIACGEPCQVACDLTEHFRFNQPIESGLLAPLRLRGERIVPSLLATPFQFNAPCDTGQERERGALGWVVPTIALRGKAASHGLLEDVINREPRPSQPCAKPASLMRVGYGVSNRWVRLGRALFLLTDHVIGLRRTPRVGAGRPVASTAWSEARTQAGAVCSWGQVFFADGTRAWRITTIKISG